MSIRLVRTWVACCIATSLALADGMAFKYRLDFSAVRPLAENEQMAIIAHRDGRQRMLLAVSFDEMKEDDRAVWIVPIPGTPSEIEIDVADEMPHIIGRDVLRSADAARGQILTFAALFSVAPVCFMIPSLSAPSGLANEHMAVSKHGLRLATVTATNAEELIEYFRKQAVHPDADLLRSLVPYMNERHTFVIGWVSSIAELLSDYPELQKERGYFERRPGFRIEFPSDVPFFPLVPTSYYGDVRVPLRLIVEGFLQPPADIGWSSYETRWGRRTHNSNEEICEFFQVEPNASFDYTVITTNVPAREYTRDLRLEPANSPRLRRALWTMSNIPGPFAPLYVLLVIAVCSYVAGGLTGLVFFGRWRPLAVFGLTNLLTVLGMMFCVRLVKFSEISSWWPTTHENVKRRCFVLGFVIIYLVTLPLVGWPLIKLIA